MDESIKFETEKPGESGTIAVNGPLDISRAKEARDALLRALEEVKTLVVDLAGLTDADITTLQVLCSAHLYCLKTGKKISIQGEVPGVLRELIDQSGYRRRLGCKAGGEEDCLWSSMEETHG